MATSPSISAKKSEGLAENIFDIPFLKGVKVSKFDSKQALSSYREMLLIRRFEEKSGQLYGMGLIGGFCHLCIGQEAVIIGIKMALSEGDQMITAYRDHGHILSCGTDASKVMAELTGRQGGISKGKGGSMHLFDTQNGFYGGHGIVGAQVSLGTGIAFSNKYRKTDKVCVVCFGDGAANQGQVYESFNMAALWKLNAIYVVENNQYAMGTSVARSSAQTNFSKKGISFNIPGVQVDGMDVNAVKETMEKAVAYCRANNGPIIVEMLTYRYRGHSMSDPASYRSRDEVNDMRSNHDPIEKVREKLLKNKWATENDLKTIESDVRKIINDSVEFATSDEEPNPSELYSDILI